MIYSVSEDGVTLTVQAQTQDEVRLLFSRTFGLAHGPEEVLEAAQWYSSPTPLEYTISRSLREKGWRWYCVTTRVDDALLPYWEALAGRVGPVLFGLDLTEVLRRKMIHYIFIEAAEVDAVTGVLHVRAWVEGIENVENELLHAKLNDRIIRSLWREEVPRELIQTGSGSYKLNPDYASGKPLRLIRGAGCDEVLKALFDKWEHSCATPRQRALLEAARLLGRYNDPMSQSQSWSYRSGFLVPDPGGPVDWDGNGTRASEVKWEQFREEC